MKLTPVVARPLVGGVLSALLLTAVAPAVRTPMSAPAAVRASESSHAVDGYHDFPLPAGTTHLAIHWPGHPNAEVTMAFSTDGTTFGAAAEVERDDVGAGRGNGETYGSVWPTGDARAVRVASDRPLPKVSVLAMDAVGQATVIGFGERAAASAPIPGVISRSGWGAAESVRFDQVGEERWGRAWYPLQKVIIHHTAGANYDPNPAATVRAIYYYHAVTQDWGDIGYQFLIDNAGRIYEGRYSRNYWNGATPTADNGAGRVIEGGHALYYNPGTMGIAMMGTFTSTAPSAAARASLVRLVAWVTSTYGINPTGSSTYVNPVSGITRATPNIAGHRDYNQTGCPGAAFYAMLPTIRSQVAAQFNSWPSQVFNPPRKLSFAAGTYVGRKFSPSGTITASKSYTLGAPSAAPTSQQSTIPNQSGNWYYVTAGVWAGYWIQGSAGVTLGPAPPPPVTEEFSSPRPLTLGAGTHVGRIFSSAGVVIGSKSSAISSASTTWTTQRSTIPNQTGNWFYVTAGIWSGYWIPETANTTLSGPAGPWPDPIAEYDPPAPVQLAAGTHVGYQFNTYGYVARTKSYTLAAASSAPTSEKRVVPTQTGNWFYITAGVWAGYWIRESASAVLGTPPPPPPPPVSETYDPPKTLSFAAGNYVGRQFNASGVITASKPYTLATASSAPTSQKSTIPNQTGSWFYITAGVWAGYWIQEGPGITLSGP